VKRFVVYGQAFVPVKVRVEVIAENADAAMIAANKKLKTNVGRYLMPGSHDDRAAWGFDASDAEEIVP